MRLAKTFIIMIFMLCVPAISYSNAIGTQELSFLIPNSDRELVAEIYYPTASLPTNSTIDHDIWKRIGYTKDAPIKSSKEGYPLVIFSHGFQGDRFGNSWIAETLVAQGYIVAMIDHTHNTSYDHSDLFIYTSIWQRPLDMSALITYLFDHPQWGTRIDKDKIAAVGFSLGGLTALWLGGIEANDQFFKQEMDSRYSRWPDWPKAARDEAAAFNWKKATCSYYDERVKVVIAFAPDLGKGFTADGLMKMKVPTLIIVGNNDPITPAKENAEYYSRFIPNAQFISIMKAKHFNFMNTCSNLGEKIRPHLCEDNLTRAKMHQEVGVFFNQFLSKYFSTHCTTDCSSPRQRG